MDVRQLSNRSPGPALHSEKLETEEWSQLKLALVGDKFV